MERFSKQALAVAALCLGTCLGPPARTMAAGGGEEGMLQADHAFVAAVAKVDKQALAKLLDGDFSWTDSNGKTQSKQQVLRICRSPESAMTRN